MIKKVENNMKILFLAFILIFPALCFAKREHSVQLKDNVVSTISISLRGAVLNFPTKPSKVIMGNTGSFSIEYVNTDLVISPLRSDARAHVFVYLEGRRFNLDLVASGDGYTLVEIRDATGRQVEVQYAK